MASRASKTCAVCGREIQWRKKWARHWEHVRYCSKACRRHKLREIDRELERVILARLRSKSRGALLDPNEAIAAMRFEDSKALYEPARRAARRLVDRGLIEIVQDGRVVDPSRAAGTIRLRLATP